MNVRADGWISHRPSTVIGAVLVLLLASSPASAAAIHVPIDFPTLQGAINAATDGDSIIVGPDTYTESIDFLGKAITVESEDGPAVTVIDGNYSDTVVKFQSGETRSSILRGFTIQHGQSSYFGAGILMYYASPTIVGNIITDNRGCEGVGLFVYAGGPLIQGNTITRNIRTLCTGGTGGGGVLVFSGPGATVEILNNVISQNRIGDLNGGGISIDGLGNVIVRANTITNNCCGGTTSGGRGGGIYVAADSNTLVADNLIVGNRGLVGAGMYLSGSSLVVNNTIVTLRQNDGPAVLVDLYGSGTQFFNNVVVAHGRQDAFACYATFPSLKWNNVFNTYGSPYGGCGNPIGVNGNISSDPMFVDAQNGDYRLRPESPSVDAGDNCAPGLPAKDFDGDQRILPANTIAARVDMGADELVPTFTTVTTPFTTTTTTQHASYSIVDIGTLGGTRTDAAALGAHGEVIGISALPGDRDFHAFVYVNGAMTDIGVLGVPPPVQGHPGHGRSTAAAINDTGEIVGQSSTDDGSDHAFKFTGGTISDLGTLPDTITSTASAINGIGQIVGTAYSTNPTKAHAFLDSGGLMTDIGSLDPDSPYGAFATDINDSGQIIGVSGSRAFLYSGGVMTDLGTLGGSFASAVHINTAGQVLGLSDTGTSNHAFLYHDGVMTDLGTLGGSSSSGRGLNDLGDVVGDADTELDGRHAFLYSDGVMHDLGSLDDGTCASSSIAYGINNSRQVVGESGVFSRPFLYDGGVMLDLNTLVVGPVGLPAFAPAIAINDAGQILCSDIIDGRAFLLTPLPVPTTTTTIVSSSTTTTTPVTPRGCSDAHATAVVRAEIETVCDCANAVSRSEYRRCSEQLIGGAVATTRLPRSCKSTVRHCIARSTCGRPGAVTCCRGMARAGTKCTITHNARACTAVGGQVGFGHSCCDACTGACQS